MHIKKNMVDHPHLFQSSQVIVKLQPHILAQLIYFQIQFLVTQAGVLVARHQPGAVEQILRSSQPLTQAALYILKLQRVDQIFESSLIGGVVGRFPGLLQVGNNIDFLLQQLPLHGTKNLVAGIVQQTNESEYFISFHTNSLGTTIHGVPDLTAEPFKYIFYQTPHLSLIILTVGACQTIGNNYADRGRFMPQEASQTINGRALHLVVGNALFTMAKGSNAFVDIGHGQGQTQDPALGAIKAGSRYGYAGLYLLPL